MGPKGPFPEIAELAVEDKQKIIDTACNKLREEVVAILKTIRAAFQRQKNKKKHDSPEGQRFRKELHELVAEARRILDGVMRESLVKCKRTSERPALRVM
jgi:hypothetical protein